MYLKKQCNNTSGESTKIYLNTTECIHICEQYSYLNLQTYYHVFIFLTVVCSHQHNCTKVYSGIHVLFIIDKRNPK